MQRFAGERLEDEDLAARQERGVDLERRILGGSADEGDETGLDVRQERVLLYLVEAMNLVDEQDGTAVMVLARLASAFDDLPELLDAAHHRRDVLEVGFQVMRQHPR